MAHPDAGPASPLSALAAGAAQMHELYTEYVKAGFSNAEALELLKALITKGR